MSQTRTPDFPIDPVFVERWSPRAFTAEEIPAQQLMVLLEAARWAPSSYNIQPWRFVFARRGGKGWTPILAALNPFNQAWAQHAAALVVVMSAEQSQPSDGEAAQPNAAHAFDAGAAWASLALQARLSGWATHAMGGFDAAKLRQALRAPDGLALHAVVAVGRKADASTLPVDLQEDESPSGRRSLAETVFEGAMPALQA
jgi:nitroreductase